MTGFRLRLMVSACKNRIDEGKSWDEIKKIYPKLTDEEIEQIKKEIEAVS